MRMEAVEMAAIVAPQSEILAGRVNVGGEWRCGCIEGGRIPEFGTFRRVVLSLAR